MSTRRWAAGANRPFFPDLFPPVLFCFTILFLCFPILFPPLFRLLPLPLVLFLASGLLTTRASARSSERLFPSSSPRTAESARRTRRPNRIRLRLLRILDWL